MIVIKYTSDIDEIAMSFGINPVNGGSPPSDISRIVIVIKYNVLVFCKLYIEFTVFLFLAASMINRGVMIAEYIKK